MTLKTQHIGLAEASLLLLLLVMVNQEKMGLIKNKIKEIKGLMTCD
jgi:hypothetical protein